MGRIVAIAGGDLQTTKAMNQYAVKLTNKQNPNLLFIGTASEDDENYFDCISKVFSELKCNVKELPISKKEYANNEIDSMLKWADLIYVGGGNTCFMIETWKKYSLNNKLIQIYHKDEAVLMGISAGAMCWFTCGHSDSEAFMEKEDWHFTWVEDLLNLHHYAFCPHYNEKGRKSFDEMLKAKNIMGLAMENETAFIEENGNVSFMRSREDAKAYRIDFENGIMEKREIIF